MPMTADEDAVTFSIIGRGNVATHLQSRNTPPEARIVFHLDSGRGSVTYKVNDAKVCRDNVCGSYIGQWP